MLPPYGVHLAHACGIDDPRMTYLLIHCLRIRPPWAHAFKPCLLLPSCLSVYAVCAPRVTLDLASAMPTEGTHHEDPTVTIMAPQNASTSRGDTLDERKQPSRHPGQTILVFSVALAPLIILPYVLVRRHVVGLRKEIAELRRANVVLVKETRTSMQAMSQQHAAAFDRASQLLEDTRDLLVKVRSEVEAGREATQVQEARLERVEDHLSQLMTAVKDTDREAGVRAAELKNMLSVMINTAKERENKAQAWRKSTSATMEVLLDEKRVRCVCCAIRSRAFVLIHAPGQSTDRRCTG